jgi:hypothetical protein
MTNKRTIQIGDVVRNMTDAECAELDAEFALLLENKLRRNKERQALLDRLGITADEAALLIG